MEKSFLSKPARIGVELISWFDKISHRATILSLETEISRTRNKVYAVLIRSFIIYIIYTVNWWGDALSRWMCTLLCTNLGHSCLSSFFKRFSIMIPKIFSTISVTVISSRSASSSVYIWRRLNWLTYHKVIRSHQNHYA